VKCQVPSAKRPDIFTEMAHIQSWGVAGNRAYAAEMFDALSCSAGVLGEFNESEDQEFPSPESDAFGKVVADHD
jgi:hypothetical protein